MAGDWPDEERRTDDAPDSGRRRRMTDVDLPPTARELERALQAHEGEAREWRARHDERLKDVEEQSVANRELLDGILGTLNKMSGTVDMVEKICLSIDRKVEPPSRLDRTLSILVPVLLAALPVLGAYLALKGQISQVTEGP